MTELFAIPDPTDPIDLNDEIMTSNQSSVAGTGYRPLGTVIIGTLAAGGAIASGDLAVIQQGGVVVRKAIGDMSEQDAASVGITGGNIDGTVIGGTTPAAATFTDAQINNDMTVGDGTGANSIILDKGETASAEFKMRSVGMDRFGVRLGGSEVTQLRSYDASGVLINNVLSWDNTATTDKVTVGRGVTISDTTDASSPTDGGASLHTEGGASIEKTLYANAIEDTPIGGTTPANGTFTNINTTGTVSVNSDASGSGLASIDKGDGDSAQLQYLNAGVLRLNLRLNSSEQMQFRSHDASGVLINNVLSWGNTAATDKITAGRGITINNTADASSPTDTGASLHTEGGISAEGRIVGNVMSMGPRAAPVISGGIITITSSNMFVDTEGGAATDDLDTINMTGVADGDMIRLRSATAARVVTLKDGTGNLDLLSDFALLTNRYQILLIWDAGPSRWQELSRSANP